MNKSIGTTGFFALVLGTFIYYNYSKIKSSLIKRKPKKKTDVNVGGN